VSKGSPFSACGHSDLVELFAVDALQPEQKAGFSSHLDACDACRCELNSLEPVVRSLSDWPGAEISPDNSLWQRLLSGIGQADIVATPFASLPELQSDEWEQPAPGIFCRILSTDRTHSRVCMLVRLDPGVAYPPHTHAGVEELHLLDGELWIENRKLTPGDYNRAEPGTSDRRVWTATGCTCVLITSPGDVLS
jgi:anti-sigma factor ChrR (cupin superfamily)